ncbi:MAG: pyridoxamine 5'-phosphate oxidase family protein, partial [Symbiobacteriaceae bacterium]|nr:pyridoxamine 5'-phosphate oxidase family protein [Symbiobacteriaceae bacterium]
FTASGIGENLGWALDPKNAELRTKLRSAFVNWYDFANNENDENCCYLAIRLTSGIINVNHHETLIYMDFTSQTATLKGKEI